VRAGGVVELGGAEAGAVELDAGALAEAVVAVGLAVAAAHRLVDLDADLRARLAVAGTSAPWQAPAASSQ